MRDGITDEEQELGELACRKVELTEELKGLRDRIKTLARGVELPVCIHLRDGEGGYKSVTITKGPSYSEMPQMKVFRCVIEE